jgi:hypothetical protein
MKEESQPAHNVSLMFFYYAVAVCLTADLLARFLVSKSGTG